jgi:hypothetical protein
MQMIEFNIGYIMLFILGGILVTAWLTIDGDESNKKFQRQRKGRFEDEEI